VWLLRELTKAAVFYRSRIPGRLPPCRVRSFV